MFAIKNFTDNDDVRVLGSMGPFTVVEYLKDLSVTPSTAMTAYYCNEMNVRKRQVICDLSKANITLQAGAMQWMAGNVNATTGLKGVGDFFGKAVRGKVTGESAVKPEYTCLLYTSTGSSYTALMDTGDQTGQCAWQASSQNVHTLGSGQSSIAAEESAVEHKMCIRDSTRKQGFPPGCGMRRCIDRIFPKLHRRRWRTAPCWSTQRLPVNRTFWRYWTRCV